MWRNVLLLQLRRCDAQTGGRRRRFNTKGTDVAVSAPKRTKSHTGLQPHDARGLAVIETLRATFARQGIHESRSDAQEGYYFVVGAPGEVSLQYNEIDDGATPLRRNGTALLKCCHELARHGFAFTLFMSPRTATLHVRSD